MNNKEGCEYGRTNRIYILDEKENILLIQRDILDIKKNLQRAPIWSTGVISILTALLGFAVSRITS